MFMRRSSIQCCVLSTHAVVRDSGAVLVRGGADAVPRERQDSNGTLIERLRAGRSLAFTGTLAATHSSSDALLFENMAAKLRRCIAACRSGRQGSALDLAELRRKAGPLSTHTVNAPPHTTRQRDRRTYSTSNANAMPCPPPMHSVTMPRLSPSRRIE
jgi:hypothetical protein